MDDTYNDIDTLRHLLYTAITNNKDLSNGLVLELSQKLDKVIVDVYNKQPGVNQKNNKVWWWVVIRETIEIYREDTSKEGFKKEIDLLKSAGYEVIEKYASFRQTVSIDEPDIKVNKKPTINIID